MNTEGSEKCTIYCKVGAREEVEEIVASFFLKFELNHGHQEGRLVYGSSSATLEVTPTRFIERADKFSRTRLSTHVEVERISREKRIDLSDLLAHIRECKLIIGIVASPSFEADNRFGDVVFDLSKQLQGVVFNGSVFLDSNGAVIAER